jgi:Bcr/CflA subfamily drug resistance transporter
MQRIVTAGMFDMQSRHRTILSIILFLAPISGMGIDIYAPSLPHIATIFSISHLMVKNTISVYLLGFAIGQIFAGSLSEVYGRKPVLVFGLILFILSCLLAVVAEHIMLLMVARFIQGLAVTAPVVMVKTLATDSFTREEMKKISTYFVISWSMGPIIAPVIGGYLQTYIAWWANFLFLAIYAFILLIVVIFALPETHKEKISFNFGELLGQYKIIIRDKKFLTMSLSLALSYSMIILFNVLGPFILQKGLGYSAVGFGHIAFFMGFACLIGSVSNRYLISKKPVQKLIKYSELSITLISLIALIVFIYLGKSNLMLVIIPTFLIILCVGIIFPNFSGICLSQFPKMAGAASAVLGVINILGTTISSVVASMFHTTEPWPLFGLYFIFGLILMAICFFVFNNNDRSSK